jgi:replication factor C small subunit
MQLIEKYAPHKLDDLVLDSTTRNTLQSFLNQKTIPNMLLSGKQGIGKSTIARIIIKELGAEQLFINGSVDNGVDIVKTRINQFVEVCPEVGKLKIVFIDEADALTMNTNSSSAQDALRNVIDKSMSDTRFILTCNYPEKISDPLKSRCSKIDVTFSKNDVIRRVIEIVKQEKISCTKENFTAFISLIIDKSFPDIRNIINSLQILSVSGELIPTKALNNRNISELAGNILSLVLGHKQLYDIRELYINKSDLFNSDYEILCGEIFDAISESTTIKNIGDCLIICAEFTYRIHQVQLNKEIQFAALILKLLSTIKQ